MIALLVASGVAGVLLGVVLCEVLVAAPRRRVREFARHQHVIWLRHDLGLAWADPRECCGVCGMRGTADEPCDGGLHG